MIWSFCWRVQKRTVFSSTPPAGSSLRQDFQVLPPGAFPCSIWQRTPQRQHQFAPLNNCVRAPLADSLGAQWKLVIAHFVTLSNVSPQRTPPNQCQARQTTDGVFVPLSLAARDPPHSGRPAALRPAARRLSLIGRHPPARDVPLARLRRCFRYYAGTPLDAWGNGEFFWRASGAELNSPQPNVRKPSLPRKFPFDPFPRYPDETIPALRDSAGRANPRPPTSRQDPLPATHRLVLGPDFAN
jgi:hypothetical protein